MFLIDGLAWNAPCDIERVSEIAPSEISGLLLDGSYFNDVLGQYLRYEVALAVPLTLRDEYAALYEKLTEPVEGHRFELPYNGGTVSVTGRVERVRDCYVRMADGTAYWKGVRFSVAANHPTRALSLSEMIARGRAPLPEAAAPKDGDAYVFTDGRWVVAERYEDGEGRRF